MKILGPDIKGELKWKELAMRIEHYKFYLNIALQGAAFFYLITGGVLGFYLKEGPESAKSPEYVLLLPILIGSVLGGIFVYGARLQVKAINSMEQLRSELSNEFGLNIKGLYDAHLLNILLRIFGYMFFAVGIALCLVPYQLAKLSLESSRSGSLKNLTPFWISASVILIVGGALPIIARWFDKRLKKRRKTEAQEVIGFWLDDIKSMEPDDILALRSQPSYDEWLKTIESIKHGTFGTDLLEQDAKKLEHESETGNTQRNKFKKIRKILKTVWGFLTDA